ncbi:MAG: hypothetical protein AAF153_03130, partial [Pseudomonadota bacterium]
IKDYFNNQLNTTLLHDNENCTNHVLSLPSNDIIEKLPKGLEDEDLKKRLNGLTGQELSALVAATYRSDKTPDKYKIPEQFKEVLQQFEIINAVQDRGPLNGVYNMGGINAVAYKRNDKIFLVISGLEMNFVDSNWAKFKLSQMMYKLGQIDCSLLLQLAAHNLKATLTRFNIFGTNCKRIVNNAVPDLWSISFDLLETQTRLALELMNEIEQSGKPCTLIGHSMGTIIADTLKVVQFKKYKGSETPKAITVEQRGLGASLYKHISETIIKINSEHSTDEKEVKEILKNNLQTVGTFPNSWTFGRVSGLGEGDVDQPNSTPIIVLPHSRVNQLNTGTWQGFYANIQDTDIHGSHRSPSSMEPAANGEAEFYAATNLPRNMGQMFTARGVDFCGMFGLRRLLSTSDSSVKAVVACYC